MEFNSVDEAQEAYTAMKGQEIDGRQIFVDFAGERGSNNCYEYLTFKSQIYNFVLRQKSKRCMGVSDIRFGGLFFF